MDSGIGRKIKPRVSALWWPFPKEVVEWLLRFIFIFSLHDCSFCCCWWFEVSAQNKAMLLLLLLLLFYRVRKALKLWMMRVCFIIGTINCDQWPRTWILKASNTPWNFWKENSLIDCTFPYSMKVITTSERNNILKLINKPQS